MTTQSASLRIADELFWNPWAWPGGYPRFAITGDGDVLCSICCHTERRQIASCWPGDQWQLVGTAINWEDPDLSCSHCGSRIESAYEAPEEPQAGVRIPLHEFEHQAALVGCPPFEFLDDDEGEVQ